MCLEVSMLDCVREATEDRDVGLWLDFTPKRILAW